MKTKRHLSCLFLIVLCILLCSVRVSAKCISEQWDKTSWTSCHELCSDDQQEVGQDCGFFTCFPSGCQKECKHCVQCPFGFTGRNCLEEIDRCKDKTDNCNANSYCEKTSPGEFKCSCKHGYATSECVPINHCSLQSHDCKKNTDCVYEGPDKYSCKCKDGYENDHDPLYIDCEPIDNCLDRNIHNCPTNITCSVTGPGTNNCTCNAGFRGNDPLTKCDSIDNCLEENHVHGCVEFSNCISTGPGQNDCVCKKNYVGNGRIKCTEKLPCLENTHNCDTHATCNYIPGGNFLCICEEGYEDIGSDDTAPGLMGNCKPINNCLLGPEVHFCGAHSTCNYTGPGMNSCKCNLNEGYEWDDIGKEGSSCNPIDYCSKMIKGTFGGCLNYTICNYVSPGKHECLCLPKYEGNPKEGCTPINPCTDALKCKFNQDCLYKGPDEHECKCKQHYVSVGDECEAVNPCMSENNCAAEGSSCRMTNPGFHKCTCIEGYIGDGITCVREKLCEKNNGGCYFNATCKEVTVTTSGDNPIVVMCMCPHPMTGNGRTCEYPIIEEKKIDILIKPSQQNESIQQPINAILASSAVVITISIVALVVIRWHYGKKKKKSSRNSFPIIEDPNMIGMHVNSAFARTPNSSRSSSIASLIPSREKGEIYKNNMDFVDERPELGSEDHYASLNKEEEQNHYVNAPQENYEQLRKSVHL